jgi:hypothetical protein
MPYTGFSAYMGYFYIFWTLFPCVIGQLQERWLRHIAKKWINHDATVIQQTLAGVWAPTVEIRYQFDVNGEPHEGNFQRRYQNKTSAGNVPIYEPGARIEILVDPKNPDRSYFPLPLSVWGLLYAAPIAALMIVAVLGGLYSGLEQRRFDAKHRIPEADCKRIRYCPLFNIRFPANNIDHGNGIASRMAIEGEPPVLSSWRSRREGFFFEADFYEYRLPPAPDKVFALIRSQFAAGSGTSQVVERPLVYTSMDANLRAGHPITWRGSTGHLFGYSQPGWVAEAYVSGRDVYVISTNWYIQSDVQIFFDSMQPAERLN